MGALVDAEDILARYRRYRELTIKHHNDAIDRVATDTMLERARQLGLASGRTFTFDDEQEWPLVCDLALYTAPAGRSRAVDRHTKAALPKADGEEADVLRAMAAARYSLWKVERHHESTGVILTDTIRGDEVWLVDEAFGYVAKPGWIAAIRLLPVAAFYVTSGTMVPIDNEAIVRDLSDRLSWVRDRDKDRLSTDPRLPVAVYRAALQHGVLNRVRYRQMDEALPLPDMPPA